MIGPKTHDFSLDDQLTADFVHQMSLLFKYFISGSKDLSGEYPDTSS